MTWIQEKNATHLSFLIQAIVNLTLNGFQEIGILILLDQ